MPSNRREGRLRLPIGLAPFSACDWQPIMRHAVTNYFPRVRLAAPHLLSNVRNRHRQRGASCPSFAGLEPA